MSWDESLFRFVWGGLERMARRTTETEEQKNQVLLSDVEARLRLLACALTGEDILIREAEAVGGYQGRSLFLPRSMDVAATPEANAKAYIYRVLYTLSSRALGHHLPSDDCSEEEGLRLTALAHESTLEAMTSECPRVVDLLEPQLRVPTVDELRQSASKLFGRLMVMAAAGDGAAEGIGEVYSKESLSSGREKKAAKAVENIIEVKLGDDQLDENPLVHSFEKVHTAEEYTGGKKTLDGSDELDDHAEALEELNLRHVIRSRDRAESVYRGGYALESGAPDLADDAEDVSPSGIFYDEWDDTKKTYRKSWCQVFARPAPVVASPVTEGAEPSNIDRRQVRELRQALMSLTNERRWRGRQIDGPEIDLDAVVDYRATLRSGHSPSNRLYLSRRRHERDLATLILMDLSLSTDAWIENNRVLDISKSSVLMLAEVLEGIHDKTAVGGFYSNTRRDCRYLSFKDFKEPWRTCRPRLAGVQPTGYTRIGPALRHATTLLKQVPAKKRLLLLISDGKPTDYDRYEGRYGIADVKQAIREAHSAGVGTRALAVDAEAKFYLPQMFGHGNYEILPHPARLASCLAKIYAEVLR